MLHDPVLPAAIIARQKTAATLGGADNLVRYDNPRPLVASPNGGNQWTHGDPRDRAD